MSQDLERRGRGANAEPAAGDGDDGSRVGRMARRGWRSPTLMSWSSYGSHFLSFVLVLPLVLTRLSVPEIALWYIFTTLISLQLLADMGFSNTFVRAIAYGMGGAGVHELRRERGRPVLREAREPNWETVESICATMRVVYNRITFVAMAGLATLGTLSVMRPISATAEPERAWIAWAVILVGSGIKLRGNLFSAYLQGVNQVAVLRRWEAITNVASIVAKIGVLLAGGGILALVVVNQGWMLVNIARNWWLCRSVKGGRFRAFSSKRIDPEVFGAVWPAAWRTGLGVVLGQAPVKFTGLIFAQFGSPAGVATYLLALRLLTTIRALSVAPFNSKMPRLSRLRAEGRIPEQLAWAQRGMRLSHWTFAAGFVGLGLLGDPLLRLIGSRVSFPDPLLWGLLGMAIFVQRFVAMHLQLYSTTNHITVHRVNAVSAAVFAVITVALIGRIGVYAFPLGYLLSYLGYPLVHSARMSYGSLAVRPWVFERSVLVGPGLVILAYGSYSLLQWFTR